MSDKIGNDAKKKRYKQIYYVALLISIAVLVFSTTYLIRYFAKSQKSEMKFVELKEQIEEEGKAESKESIRKTDRSEALPEKIEYVTIDGVEIQKKFESLYRQNSDFVGWLKIEGTAIDYPVMQSVEDSDYYIDKDFDKKYSSAGTLFADAGSDIAKPSDNILIYGHNMKSGTMFRDLLKYEKKSFYENHRQISFDTLYGNNTYEVIAAFRTKIEGKKEEFKYYQFFYQEEQGEFDSYVTTCQKMTPYSVLETAEYGDELLTLSTCAYHDTNGRYVVVAKKIKESVAD